MSAPVDPVAPIDIECADEFPSLGAAEDEHLVQFIGVELGPEPTRHIDV